MRRGTSYTEKEQPSLWGTYLTEDPMQMPTTSVRHREVREGCTCLCILPSTEGEAGFLDPFTLQMFLLIHSCIPKGVHLMVPVLQSPSALLRVSSAESSWGLEQDAASISQCPHTFKMHGKKVQQVICLSWSFSLNFSKGSFQGSHSDELEFRICPLVSPPSPFLMDGSLQAFF